MLGINFIQWIALRSDSDTQFVAVALFVVTLELQVFMGEVNISSMNEMDRARCKSGDPHHNGAKQPRWNNVLRS